MYWVTQYILRLWPYNLYIEASTKIPDLQCTQDLHFKVFITFVEVNDLHQSFLVMLFLYVNRYFKNSIFKVVCFSSTICVNLCSIMYCGQSIETIGILSFKDIV